MNFYKYLLVSLVIFFAVFLLPKISWATNWYVDKDATGSNSGTSWTNAWHGFDHVVWGAGGVVAGDTLYISGGETSKTYVATKNNMLTVGAAGTSGNFITIATGAKSPFPSGHDGKVIFDGADLYYGIITVLQNYVKIDGGKNGAINWEVKNTLRTSLQHALVFSAAMRYRGKIITYLSIHDVANAINAPAPDNVANALEISYSEIYNVIGDHAISVTGAAAATLGAIKIHHNTITVRADPAQGYYGPDAIQATYAVDIYNNIFNAESATDLGVQHPDFIQFDFHLCRVWNNVFNGNGVGINSAIFRNYPDPGPTTISDFKFYNNIIFNMGWSGFAWSTGTGNTSVSAVIANNTFVDNNAANYPLAINLSSSNTTPDIIIENNILYNSGRATGPPMQVVLIKFYNESQKAGITFDYNLINAGAHGSTVAQWAVIGQEWTSITQPHGQIGVPSFLFYIEYSANNNFHLVSSDVASKDHGVSLYSYFTSDKDGVSRPQGSAWDIGAYEYAAASPPPDTTPPEAPTGLSII